MDKLREDIKIYCDANGEDVETYTNKILRIGFNVDRYGSKPSFMESKVKTVTKKSEETIDTKVLKEPIVKENKEQKDIYGE